MKQFFVRFLFISVSIGFVFGCAPKAKTPLVGISCSRTESGPDYLSPNYTKAISRAGGIPFIIPTVRSEEEALSIIGALDVVVFVRSEGRIRLLM